MEGVVPAHGEGVLVPAHLPAIDHTHTILESDDRNDIIASRFAGLCTRVKILPVAFTNIISGIYGHDAEYRPFSANFLGQGIVIIVDEDTGHVCYYIVVCLFHFNCAVLGV